MSDGKQQIQTAPISHTSLTHLFTKNQHTLSLFKNITHMTHLFFNFFAHTFILSLHSFTVPASMIELVVRTVEPNQRSWFIKLLIVQYQLTNGKKKQFILVQFSTTKGTKFCLWFFFFFFLLFISMGLQQWFSYLLHCVNSYRFLFLPLFFINIHEHIVSEIALLESNTPYMK